MDQPVQRQGPRRLDAQDHRLPGGRELRGHLPGRGRRHQGLLRQVPQVRRQVRAPLLEAEVLPLPAAGRVPVRGRAVPRRSGVGPPQQRRDDPLPAGRDDAAGPGVPRLDRGPVPRRRRQEGAGDRERLHAGHPRRRGRQARQDAHDQLASEDLPRRPVGHRRGRGPRRRGHQAHRRGRDGAGVREAAVRRPRSRRPEADPETAG